MKFRFWCEQCKMMMYYPTQSRLANESTSIIYNDDMKGFVLLDNTVGGHAWACDFHQNYNPNNPHKHIMMRSTESISSDIDEENEVYIDGPEIFQDDILFLDDEDGSSQYFRVEPEYNCFWIPYDCGEYDRQPLNYIIDQRLYAVAKIVGNWWQNPELREKCR